jgi:hypothetical protein
MSEVRRVLIIRIELICETESVIEVDALTCAILVDQEVVAASRLLPIIIPGNIVLHIGDVLAATEPAKSFLIVPFFGPDARFHALLVQTCGLGQVEDVELYSMPFTIVVQSYILINHLEVVPLGMTSSIHVIFQPKVVLNVGYF